jgi:hypothetical protein
MKRIILSTLVALTAFGGVASADHGRGGVRHAQGGVTVTPSRGHWEQRPRYTYSRGYDRGHNRSYNRGYIAPVRFRYVRRPIYVQRPVIQFRYTDYYRRPTVLVENYQTMPGYYWVAGRWDWNGYEWIWTPGHYEPDPNAAGYYSDTPSSSYYENPTYDPNYSYDSY